MSADQCLNVTDFVIQIVCIGCGDGDEYDDGDEGDGDEYDDGDDGDEYDKDENNVVDEDDLTYFFLFYIFSPIYL